MHRKKLPALLGWLGKLLSLFIVLFIVLAFLVVTIYKYKPVFGVTYQAAIVKKYDVLREVESPKVILCGDSSLAFGADSDLMTELLGQPVVNMGLHAGMGYFQVNLVKDEIRPGDTVVLTLAYNLWYKNIQDPALIVTGLESRPELFRYVDSRYYGDMIRYFPTYLTKKLDILSGESELEVGGAYCNEAFDGDRLIPYRSSALPDDVDSEAYLINVTRNGKLDPEIIKSVNELNNHCIDRGAELLISFPPLPASCAMPKWQQIYNFVGQLKNELDAPIISEPQSFFLNDEYFFDTVYHCTTEGERIRSTVLCEDILNYKNQNK